MEKLGRQLAVSESACGSKIDSVLDSVALNLLSAGRPPLLFENFPSLFSKQTSQLGFFHTGDSNPLFFSENEKSVTGFSGEQMGS